MWLDAIKSMESAIHFKLRQPFLYRNPAAKYSFLGLLLILIVMDLVLNYLGHKGILEVVRLNGSDEITSVLDLILNVLLSAIGFKVNNVTDDKYTFALYNDSYYY